MQLTPNLNLKKPEGTDVVDIADLNGNADILDAEVTKLATSAADGRMSAADKAKLDGVAAGANNYVHPSGDGNMHVPATGTTNNARVLKAGSTAGSAAWGNVAFSELTGTNGAANDTVIGNRTVDPATGTAFSNTGTLTQILSWITKVLKAIIGTTNWFDSPPATLTSLNTNKANLASPAFSGTPTAPTPAAGDNSQRIATTGFVRGELQTLPVESMSRNAIINGNFDVWQRGTSFADSAALGYTADRYRVHRNADGGTLPTLTHSRQSSDLDGSRYYYRLTTSAAGSGFGAAAGYELRQFIENGVRALCGAGKEITVSFMARSSIPGKLIGVWAYQYYGSGGSPSALDTLTGGNFALSTTWQRYSITIATNTLFGKTFGTNDDDVLGIAIAYMWGSINAPRFGTGNVETFRSPGNIDIAQVQVCSGDMALAFQPRSYAEELALCQRYCYVISDGIFGNTNIGYGFAANSVIALIGVKLPTTMRIQPSLSATASEFWLTDGVTGETLKAISLQPDQNGRNHLTVRAEVELGLTPFRPYELLAFGTNRLFILDAEL